MLRRLKVGLREDDRGVYGLCLCLPERAADVGPAARAAAEQYPCGVEDEMVDEERV